VDLILDNKELCFSSSCYTFSSVLYSFSVDTKAAYC